MGKSWKNWKLCLASQIDICGDDGMGYIALGDLISKALVEKCGKREYPVLSMTMHDGIVFQNDRFKKDIASIDRSNYSIVGFNQLVVSFPIDEGVLAVQDITDAGIVSPAYKIWDIDQAKLVPKYLEMWLRSPRSIDYYKSKLRGTTARRRSIPEEDFLGMRVNVPPKEEQGRIVNLLTRVKGVILLREQQLSALDDLIKARFVERFGDPVSNPKGWDRVRFDTICENLDSRRVPITSTDRISGVYPYYGASGIVDYVDDYIFDEDILLISEDGANLVMRTTPIAFSVSGKVWVNNHAHVVRFKEMATQKYIEVAFSVIDISEHITGSAQPKFNQAKLNAMMFNNPPLELQKQFAAFVAQIDKSKSAIQKSLDETQLLFDSLIQKYFG